MKHKSERPTTPAPKLDCPVSITRARNAATLREQADDLRKSVARMVNSFEAVVPACAGEDEARDDLAHAALQAQRLVETLTSAERALNVAIGQRQPARSRPTSGVRDADEIVIPRAPAMPTRVR